MAAAKVRFEPKLTDVANYTNGSRGVESRALLQSVPRDAVRGKGATFDEIGAGGERPKPTHRLDERKF